MQQLVTAFANVIINPLLTLLFGAAVLVFVLGVVEFFFKLNGQGDQTSREAGKQHMIWGVVGIFVMTSAVAIINVIQNTLQRF